MKADIKDVIEWAIAILSERNDTKTACAILRKQLTNYELKTGL